VAIVIARLSRGAAIPMVPNVRNEHLANLRGLMRSQLLTGKRSYILFRTYVLLILRLLGGQRLMKLLLVVHHSVWAEGLISVSVRGQFDWHESFVIPWALPDSMEVVSVDERKSCAL
jgi:hypothetical protein